MTEPSTQKASNLARIRDNQRRSRARRKEYLQELEAKVRGCEQMGIEASAEIQSAARRVLDENRKLRALLRERGVPEEEIMAVMNSSNDGSLEYGPAAPMLSSMLDRKRACNVPLASNTGHVGVQQITTTNLPYSPLPAPTPLSIPAQHAATLNHSVSQSTLSHRNGSASPRSINSGSVDTPSSYSTPNFAPVPVVAHRELEATENMPQMGYQYEQPIHAAWGFPQEPTFVPSPVTYNNSSSCVYAANVIRTMRNDTVGTELEADLGCRNYGQDCAVDNMRFFNVMDKYSSHHNAPI